jgi:signal transduction histidine kinase
MDTNPGKNRETEVRFKPRARLLLQLGDQLIKNESIALVELIKNSYDADATKVDILMYEPDSSEEGVIIIEDDGYGMTAETVENVWLEPGSDFKSKKVRNLEASPKYKRLPIGEKGIGRFGVHKLGNIIEMTSRAADSREVFVRIDWTDFNNYTYLDQVPVKIVEREIPENFPDGKTGTRIVIRKLRKPWDRATVREVKRAITSLSSPFGEIGAFRPSFEVIDKPGWFAGLLNWEDVQEYSLFRFRVEMEGDSITHLDYRFTPWPTMPALKARQISETDPLVEVFRRIEDPNEKNKFVVLSDYRIGKVVFEGYLFDLDSYILKLGVSDKRGFRDYMRGNGGVKVFRDGLRVYDYGEPENDWLGIGYRRVQQPAKAIGNNLILGVVQLHRKDSMDLEEKTNREGFVDNEAYQAFRKSVLHTLDLIETFRAEDKKKLKDLYGPTRKSEPVVQRIAEARHYVEEKVADPKVRRRIVEYLDKIEEDYLLVNNNLLKAAGAGLNLSVVVHEAEKIIAEVEKVLQSEDQSNRALELVRHLSSLIDGYAEIVKRSAQTKESIAEIIEQALFNTEFRLRSHKVKVLQQYKEYKGTIRLKVARNLMIGTLLNLIDNSIYWLHQQAVREEDKGISWEKKIYIRLSENEASVQLVVADNGTGFLIATDNITEPFVSGKPGGMGLGLHIASEIMTSQGGSLTFPSFEECNLPEEFEDGAIILLTFKK